MRLLLLFWVLVIAPEAVSFSQDEAAQEAGSALSNVSIQKPGKEDPVQETEPSAEIKEPALRDISAPQTETGYQTKTESLTSEASSDKFAANPTVAGSVKPDGKEDENAPLSLKPGHRLLIRIYPEDEYIKGGEMEVSAEGNITLPLLGKVNVAGKKIAEAEKEIGRMLDADYLVNPEVSIELKREKTEQAISDKSFVILGQVRKPGTFPIPLEAKKFTLLQAISLGGGFTEIANSKRVKIVHKTEKDRQTIQVNVEDIFNGSAPDIEIQNGDVIHVPESIF